MAMSRLVVAVKSCHADMDRGCHDAIRETWGQRLKGLGIPTYFFLGVDPTQQETRRMPRFKSDEIVIDSKDDYMSLPTKTRRIAQWAANKLFGHVFLCDVDTLVMPGALVDSGFEQYDYAGISRCGHQPGEPTFYYKDEYGEYPMCAPWFSGGWGYFLSRNAASAIAMSYPQLWAEDMFVGNALAPLIQEGELKAGRVHPGTDHWPKCATKFEPKFMKLGYELKSFSEIFKKGLATA